MNPTCTQWSMYPGKWPVCRQAGFKTGIRQAEIREDGFLPQWEKNISRAPTGTRSIHTSVMLFPTKHSSRDAVKIKKRRLQLCQAFTLSAGRSISQRLRWVRHHCYEQPGGLAVLWQSRFSIQFLTTVARHAAATATTPVSFSGKTPWTKRRWPIRSWNKPIRFCREEFPLGKLDQRELDGQRRLWPLHPARQHAQSPGLLDNTTNRAGRSSLPNTAIGSNTHKMPVSTSYHMPTWKRKKGHRDNCAHLVKKAPATGFQFPGSKQFEQKEITRSAKPTGWCSITTADIVRISKVPAYPTSSTSPNSPIIFTRVSALLHIINGLKPHPVQWYPLPVTGTNDPRWM